MDLTVSNPGGNNNMVREYRKGNWTLQETMVLIEAKKMDDQRRQKRLGDSGERGKPTELRWKWVEDYCWKHGCSRSQNQCNDKWDNLMRDFKKVREYEKRVAEGRIGEDKSYWRIDKNERKDNNLPSNLLPQIYDALVEAVERKGQWTPPVAGGAGSSSVSLLPGVGEKSGVSILGQQHQPVMPISMVQFPVTQAITMLPAQTQMPPEPSVPPPCPAVDSDSSGEYTYSSAKRRKRDGGDGEGRRGGGGEDVGTAISRSARMIAEAIARSEEREERRHREVVSVQQRRLDIEESNRQGIHGLADAINNLANSILALADHHKPHSHSHSPPSK